MIYPIEKCKTCKRYDHINFKMRNKLYCMVGCDKYMQELNRKAFEYNRAVSGEEFDTKEMYEHGQKVFGSGWKNK